MATNAKGRTVIKARSGNYLLHENLEPSTMFAADVAMDLHMETNPTHRYHYITLGTEDNTTLHICNDCATIIATTPNE